MSNQSKVKSILTFMQSQDRNGTWLEWLDEIEKGESEFDTQYVKETLQAWYDDSNEQKYLDRLNTI